MKLTNYPADFASAFDKNLFCFDEVEASHPVELHFYDCEDNLLGVRRYVGQESVATSPQAFLLAQLNPEPVPLAEGCEFVIPSGRIAKLSVGYNGDTERTPEVLFTDSHNSLGINLPLGDGEEWRTISAGECDEIAFCVSATTTLSASAHFSDGTVVSLGIRTIKYKGVVLLGINANSILSHASAPQGATEFDVVVRLRDELCCRVHYRVVPPEEWGVRLAWLSADGSVRYHTFPRPLSKRLHTLPTTTNGSVVRMESWEELSLDSGVLPIRDAQRLAEIATSPRIWRVMPEGFVPQTIHSHSAEWGGGQPARVSLTICPQEKTTFCL